MSSRPTIPNRRYPVGVLENRRAGVSHAAPAGPAGHPEHDRRSHTAHHGARTRTCGTHVRDELHDLHRRVKKANITLNRKELSEIAIHDPKGFDAIVKEAQAARK